MEFIISKGTGNDGELAQYCNCFRNNDMEKELDVMQWLHQQNLVQENTIYYAFDDDNIAAIYTAIPVYFKVKKNYSKSLQSVDTITDKKYRGKGLFPKLAKKLYADSTNNGYELVYGFPNENSAPGFFSKLGWTSFGEVPFLVKPLSLRFILKKVLKLAPKEKQLPEIHQYNIPQTIDIDSVSKIKVLDTFSTDYDALWQELSQDIDICVNRSAAYMNWRYIQKPGPGYSIFGYFVNDQLKGIVIFTITNKHGGRIGYLMELIFDKKHPEIGKTLLKKVTRFFKQEKVDAVLAWSLPHSFNYKCFLKTGYYNLPLKLRPQHLFFGVRPLNDTNAEPIRDLNNWYISYSDSDTV